MSNVEIYGLFRWIYCEVPVLVIQQSLERNTVILRKNYFDILGILLHLSPLTPVMVRFKSWNLKKL